MRLLLDCALYYYYYYYYYLLCKPYQGTRKIMQKKHKKDKKKQNKNEQKTPFTDFICCTCITDLLIRDAQ